MPEDPLLPRLRTALAEAHPREQKMFGGACFMVDGNMVAGTSKRGLLVRVGKDGHAAALRRPHTRAMEMGGRTMQGYVFVEPEGTASEEDLRSWLELARTYVATLPPKTKGASSKKPRAKR